MNQLYYLATAQKLSSQCQALLRDELTVRGEGWEECRGDRILIVPLSAFLSGAATDSRW